MGDEITIDNVVADKVPNNDNTNTVIPRRSDRVYKLPPVAYEKVAYQF